ncbi:MAG: hypothetical protein HZC48_04865 [Nitrospirae bacterium]|nr:hypothetical protein [Nitrospirota bacterium]
MQRRSNRYIFLLLFFIAAAVAFVLYPTDEKRIRRVIAGSEDALIKKDLDGLFEYISYNYRDDYGNSYLILKKRMQIVFNRLNDIEIEKNLMGITVLDKTAEAELNVRVIASEGEAREYIIGDAVAWQEIKVYFEKSPYKWKIVKVAGLFGNRSQ